MKNEEQNSVWLVLMTLNSQQYVDTVHLDEESAGRRLYHLVEDLGFEHKEVHIEKKFTWKSLDILP